MKLACIPDEERIDDDDAEDKTFGNVRHTAYALRQREKEEEAVKI
jgi:hypothetical protein